MIIGDKSKFAIESGLTQAYARPGFRALGFFVIHIGGNQYGVCKPDATMLACSFDEVERRIAGRGGHRAPFATRSDPGVVAEALYRAVYVSDQEDKLLLGLPHSELHDLIYSNHLCWAPDGDEAFDDGSYILHFDVENRVRLIAYQTKKGKEGYCYDPETLRDAWLDADEFYDILQTWRDSFETEWVNAAKISEFDDGAEMR